MGILSGISILPLATTLPDCTSYAHTVEPYISQLIELPQQLLKAGLDVDNLRNLYLSTNPLVTAIAFALFLAPVFLIVSEVNRNYSQVDRCWSILPTVYNAHFCAWAHMTGLPTGRLDHVLAFSSVWTLRLTYNYWRKGGYSIGSEDYRWEILRKHIPAPLFFVFNVTFISLAQSILLVLVTTPTYVLLLASRVTDDLLDPTDLIASRFLLVLVVISWFADQQQWNYHQAKKSYQATAKPPPNYTQSSLDRGFLTSGLWAYSRHPNFAAEQSIWVSLYAWSCTVTKTPFHWAGVGALGYLILFQASTWFTELVTAGKYPEYKIYQARVGKFLPWPAALWTVPVPELATAVAKEEKGKGKAKA